MRQFNLKKVPTMHTHSTSQPQVSRRAFLRRSVLTAATAVTPPLVFGLATSAEAAKAATRPIDAPSLAFLREVAAATVESARVRPGQMRSGMGPNATGITVITPGGNYPALWTRDFGWNPKGAISPSKKAK